MSASPLRVRPREKSELAEPRTIERYRREVVALLRVGRGIPRSRGTLLVKRWDKYVRARWLQGKPPCNVADHIGKFEREKLVKPARDKTNKRMTRTAFARQMRPVATRRSSRASRDADNPRMGEIYETRGGSRWQVVSTSDKLITVKRAGHRTEGPYAWGKESLKGMKQVPRPLFGVGGLFGIGGAKPANENEARDPERRRRRKTRPGQYEGVSKEQRAWLKESAHDIRRYPDRRMWGVYVHWVDAYGIKGGGSGEKTEAWFEDKAQALRFAARVKKRGAHVTIRQKKIAGRYKYKAKAWEATRDPSRKRKPAKRRSKS